MDAADEIAEILKQTGAEVRTQKGDGADRSVMWDGTLQVWACFVQRNTTHGSWWGIGDFATLKEALDWLKEDE